MHKPLITLGLPVPVIPHDLCVCLCVVVVFPISCMVMCDCPSCSFSPLSPVLAELQQAHLITNKECKGLWQPSHVVGVQKGKSPEVQTKTADVLRRHEFKNASNFLKCKQTQPLIHVPVVCCTVEPSCKGHLKASIIIVSFTPTMLGHSECVPEPHCLVCTCVCMCKAWLCIQVHVLYL